MDTLQHIPIRSLDGAGPRTVERLKNLGIQSVQDLLFHLPLRYEDRTRITQMKAIRAGDHVVVEGEVVDLNLRVGRRRSLLASLTDGTGDITLRFFHFSPALKETLRPGSRLRCFAEARDGPTGLEMVHPEFIDLDARLDATLEQHLTPIYPSTEGVNQLTWRKLTDRALQILERSSWGMQDLLPAQLLEQLQLPSLGDSLRTLHRPPPELSPEALKRGDHPARRRLAFEELLAHQIALRLSRDLRRRHPAPEMRTHSELGKRLEQRLPFNLTQAQQRVIEEIRHDLRASHPMMRLAQGDVGCGKTLVALMVALDVIDSGYQVALMAPTELLAEQHQRSFTELLQPLGLDCVLMSSSLKGKPRSEVLDGLAAGNLPLVVGTHALFQQDVRFATLGLVIVDEQHRFGVHQRMALRDKGQQANQLPHQLIMTATPIPRTLAMSVYADLDLSVIDELPPGRTPVTTAVLPDTRREQVIERVRLACSQGHQAYWVCTLVEESDLLQAQAAEETARALAEHLAGLRVGLVHGRLGSADKEAVMQAFKAGELDLLVATTVIEVGVDVPNATLMIIENPERLGLAQLHQLRGRVGRGTGESFCVLMYQPPLSYAGQQRLAVMRETNDGFKIARRDLEIRGPGEVLGTRQTGEMQFRVANLLDDSALLPGIQQLADQLLREDAKSAKALIQRWIGSRQRYVDA